MILIQLSGGLGNQMFQYAFGKALQLKQAKEIKLDISAFEEGYRKFELHHFKISLPVLNSKTSQINIKNSFFQKIKEKFLPYYKKSYIEERFYHFDENLLKINHDALIKGYFQSEKYFKEYEKEIRANFAFKDAPKGNNLEMLKMIQNTPNAVSVHIRRGDFVGNPIHPVQNEYFFKEAVSILQSKIPNLHLFLFSNDMPWVQENLQFEVPFTLVNINNEENGFEDMRLMSACEHHIIANSSFSWWGAWLNPNPNKVVIAPAKWVDSQAKYYQRLDDIIPEGWIKI
jgi:hypothetical protein